MTSCFLPGLIGEGEKAHSDEAYFVLIHADLLMPLAGEYPSALIEALPELRISGDLSPKGYNSKPVDVGNQTGLYHLILGAGQNAFVGNGESQQIRYEPTGC